MNARGVDFSAKAAGVLSEERLARIITEWQIRLRLLDWDIEGRIVRAHELGDGNVGDVDTQEKKAWARVRVLHPADLDGQDLFLPDQAADWELVVVHELVHVLLHAALAADINVQQKQAEERAVHAIARALVQLHREGRALLASRDV